jgi:hypothetical protein
MAQAEEPDPYLASFARGRLHLVTMPQELARRKGAAVFRVAPRSPIRVRCERRGVEFYLRNRQFRELAEFEIDRRNPRGERRSIAPRGETPEIGRASCRERVLHTV